MSLSGGERKTEFVRQIRERDFDTDESTAIAGWLNKLKRDLAPAMLAAFDDGMLNEHFTDVFDQGPNRNREYQCRKKLQDNLLAVKFTETVRVEDGADGYGSWEVVSDDAPEATEKKVNYLSALGQEFADALYDSTPLSAPALIADVAADFLEGLPDQTRVARNPYLPDIYRVALDADVTASTNPDPSTYRHHQHLLEEYFEWATSVRILTPWPPVNDPSLFEPDTFGAAHHVIAGYSYLDMLTSDPDAADPNVREHERFYENAEERDNIRFETMPDEERFPYLLALFEDKEREKQHIVIWGRGNPGDTYSVVVRSDSEALFEWGEHRFEDAKPDAVRVDQRL